MGVSGTNIRHSGTDFVGIRGSLELDIVKMRMRSPWMDASGWHSGWQRAAMNGLNGKKF